MFIEPDLIDWKNGIDLIKNTAEVVELVDTLS